MRTFSPRWLPLEDPPQALASPLGALEGKAVELCALEQVSPGVWALVPLPLWVRRPIAPREERLAGARRDGPTGRNRLASRGW